MTVTVEIDSSWVKFVRSPAFTVVSALSGVSVSFAPYFLYLSGQGRFYVSVRLWPSRQACSGKSFSRSGHELVVSAWSDDGHLHATGSN